MTDGSTEHILVVRTDRIGDVILSLPVVWALKERFRGSRVDMLLSPATSELVSGHPHVNEIVVDDEWNRHKGLRGFLRLVRLLRSREYDVAVLLHPTFRLALLLVLLGVGRRIGSGYRWYGFLLTDRIYEHRRDALRHEAAYNLNLLRPLGIRDHDGLRFDLSVSSGATSGVDEMIRSLGLGETDRIALLHPGSGGSARSRILLKRRIVAGRFSSTSGMSTRS